MENSCIDKKLKILHLEDLQSDAELVEIQLKRASIGHEIVVVDNSKDFITELNHFSPDIILADHSLPSFNSYEALQIVKESGKKIPFILVTSTVSEEYAVDILREGADDYILKDRLQRLPNAVHNSLEKYKLEAERESFLNKIIASEADLALKNKQLIKYNQIVTHDLRSPVSNILVIADIIDQVAETERKKLFSSLKNTARNINEILNVLVDIAKIYEEAKNVNSEKALFQEAFDKAYFSLEIIARQLNTKFITNFIECASVSYSKIYLESIFLNLVSNSLKFYSPERSPVISVTTYKRQGKTFMEYADNGSGLDIEKHGKNLFGLNQTFHQNKESKGLGLFMIKNQIEATGGKIRAENKENKGIRFIIEFAE